MALSLAWSQKKPCEKFNLKMLKIMMKPIVNSIGLQDWGSNILGNYLIINIVLTFCILKTNINSYWTKV